MNQTIKNIMHSKTIQHKIRFLNTFIIHNMNQTTRNMMHIIEENNTTQNLISQHLHNLHQDWGY